MPDAADLPRFALDVLLPLCRDRFADPAHGGFHELLDAAHHPLPAPGKRLMVQCRQLYVLSQAAVLGERSGADAAERGYAFLRRAYADHTHGGWFFRVTADGQPQDRGKDLYGHAFLLFALAWLHRAFAAPQAIERAAATLDVLKQRLGAPHGGYWDAAEADWTPRTAQRRQNPHMHLLEAMLALHEATGAAMWLDEAAALVRLLRARLFDAASATLGEYFAADWSPDPARGGIVEPGHHYEWVWLLRRFARFSGDASTGTVADSLFATAERYGYDPVHGGLHDQIGRDGAALQTTRRIWPVTEAIKAQLAQIEAGRPVAAGQPQRLIGHLFTQFLRPQAGGWIETVSRDGTPLQTTLPGSTPYHIMMAAAEIAAAAPAARG